MRIGVDSTLISVQTVASDLPTSRGIIAARNLFIAGIVAVGACIGPFCSLTEAQDFYNWGEFVRWCHSTRGDPLPNPPRCIPRQQTPSQPAESEPPGPHLMCAGGQCHPEEGYDWVNPSVSGDRRVKWVPNETSQNYPNVVSSEEEGQWRPKEGYDWVNPSVLGDRRVKWVPNKTSQSYPNVVASKEEGYWHPKEGYKFINPHTSDLRVVDNGLVDNAIRATDFATSFKDEKAHLEELSGLDQYDRVEAALTILATNCVITDPLAESAAQREVVITHTKAELRDLMKRAVRASVYQMSGDIKRMVPFSWNPFGDQQRQVLAQTDREIFLLEGRAEDEIDAPANFREIRSGSGKAALEYNSGQALRQLLSINSNRLARGKW